MHSECSQVSMVPPPRSSEMAPRASCKGGWSICKKAYPWSWYAGGCVSTRKRPWHDSSPLANSKAKDINGYKTFGNWLMFNWFIRWLVSSSGEGYVGCLCWDRSLRGLLYPLHVLFCRYWRCLGPQSLVAYCGGCPFKQNSGLHFLFDCFL